MSESPRISDAASGDLGNVAAIQQAMRDLRKEMKVSQESLAHYLAVTAKTIARYENGPRGPTRDALVSLFELAKERDRRDLTKIFINAIVRTMPTVFAGLDSLEIEDQFKDVSSPEALARVRKSLRAAWELTDYFHDAPSSFHRDNAIERGVQIRAYLEEMASYLFLEGEAALSQDQPDASEPAEGQQT